MAAARPQHRYRRRRDPRSGSLPATPRALSIVGGRATAPGSAGTGRGWREGGAAPPVAGRRMPLALLFLAEAPVGLVVQGRCVCTVAVPDDVTLGAAPAARAPRGGAGRDPRPVSAVPGSRGSEIGGAEPLPARGICTV